MPAVVFASDKINTLCLNVKCLSHTCRHLFFSQQLRSFYLLHQTPGSHLPTSHHFRAASLQKLKQDWDKALFPSFQLLRLLQVVVCYPVLMIQSGPTVKIPSWYTIL